MIEYMPALGAGLLTISIVALDLYFRFRWRWQMRRRFPGADRAKSQP
jgi:hypothetical protein